jgi:hypothetical protein
MLECQNAKNTFWCKFRILRVGSVETLHHRNAEMSKCRNVKNTFWCKFRIPGVGSVESLHHRNVEMRNGEINERPCRFNPMVQMNLNIIGGILFHLTVN